MSQFIIMETLTNWSNAHTRNVFGDRWSISQYKNSKSNEGSRNKYLRLNSPVSAPTTSLADYQKVAQENLIKINNNLSSMLQETFSGIDGICKKVRLCLLETDKVLEKPELGTITSYDPQTTSEETKLNSDSSENDIKSIEKEDSPNDETQADAEINDKTEKTKGIVPFFTILNAPQPTGIKLIKSITSKLGLTRECTSENFQKTMKKVEKLTNYEHVLTSMVDDINKEIDTCYMTCQKMSGGHLSKRRRTRKSTPNPRDKSEKEKYTTQNYKINKIRSNDDCLSANDLKSEEQWTTISKNKISLLSQIDFPCVEVYRKRAITDLHRRMLAQLEASDSLVFFQKLMARNRKYLMARPQTAYQEKRPETTPMNRSSSYSSKQMNSKPNSTGLRKMYENSLWFKPRKSENINNKKHRGKNNKFKNINRFQNCIPQSYTMSKDHPHSTRKNQGRSQEKSKVFNNEVTVTNNQPLSEPEKCKMHWMRAKYFQLSHKKLKYMDILDDITKEDLVPLKAEYPRRDQITHDVTHSYLYKLLHEKGKRNKRVWEHLLISGSKRGVRATQVTSKINNKLNPSDVDKTAVKDTKGQDNTTCSPIEQKELKCPNELFQTITKSCSSDKVEIFRTLSKYIFAEMDTTRINPNTVYTVMPVHVIYDKIRMEETKREETPPQKLQLVPMKETKDNIRKGKWINDSKQSRPFKVSYDPILRKIDKEIKNLTNKREDKPACGKTLNTNSWSPKNFSPYLNKSPQRQSSERTPTKYSISDKITPNSQSMQIAELFKRNVDSRRMKHSTPSSRTSEFVTRDQHQNESNIIINLSRKKERANVHRELETKKSKDVKISKIKCEQDRKLWQNKYGKSVGQKLLNFIEKQPSTYQTPVPKYASPKPLKDPVKQQQMLEQLTTLKQKNETIQTNIQKAIEVIEHKMVDILGKPRNTQSIDAFDVMEKEITNVLSSMKSESKKGNKRKEKIIEPGSEMEKISDELFKRLDKILESSFASSSSEYNSFNSPAKCELKENQPKKSSSIIIQPVSCDMDQVRFSSTSASGEEKFTITAISPKRKPKRSISPPYLKTDSTTKDPSENELSTIRTELKKLHNELQNESSELNSDNPIKEFESFEEDLVPTNLKTNQPVSHIHEQIVNLALISPRNESSAGDQLTVTDQLKSDKEVAWSTGKGDSFDLLEPTITETCDCTIKATDEIVEQTKTEKVDRFEQTEKEKEIEKVDKLEQPERTDIVELSESYFTPRTSPLIGHRVPTEDVHSKTSKDDLSEIFELTSAISNSPEEIPILQPQDVIEEKTENCVDNNVFCQNVDKIISRVEKVYSQLEEIEEGVSIDFSRNSIPKKCTVNKTPELMESQRKQSLNSFIQPEKRPKSNYEKSPSEMYRSSSYFNVLSFLDTITDLKEENVVEVYTPRVVDTAYGWQTPLILYPMTIQQQSTLTECANLPKKKSGCLKNPSSHLNVNTVSSRSRQKVSFLLQKEEKGTQVTACPLHAKPKVEITDKAASDIGTQINKVKEQVKVYLEPSQSKLNEDVSVSDNATYQSTLEASDLSSENAQINFIVDDSKKNVVELFRNNGCESKQSEVVKVFYDTYQSVNPKSSLFSGTFNEYSISQVKESLSKTLDIKKKDSLQKFTELNLDDTPLLEPLKNLNLFVDSKLLMEAIDHRQKRRMLRRQSLISLHKKDAEKLSLSSLSTEDQFDNRNETFLKGVYVFVYLFMFTALNLEYKCIQ